MNLYDDEREIFCAALQGFVANPDFNGPVSQGSIRAAVEFAAKVVKEYHNYKEDGSTQIDSVVDEDIPF